MSYPIDLDELDEDTILAEIARRQDLRRRGLCDYCGQIAEHPTCKFPDRHRRRLREEGACGSQCPTKMHVTCILPAGHEGRHCRYADRGGDQW